jgi:predicted TIM-barrel fold metal-dependent hydrolase
MRTPEDGIHDLERIKSLGLRGVMLPVMPGVEDYDSPVYNEFWAAAADLGLPVSFHILTSGKSIGSKSFRGPKIASFLAIIRDNQDVIALLIFGAVLERNPTLRVVCVEADAGWVPHWCYRADHAQRRHGWLQPVPLPRMPSEYFAEQVYVTFQDDWVAFEMAHRLNDERLMWANDFPHSDSTWPVSQQMLAEHTRCLTARQKERILGQNCAELYGITI